MAGFMDLIQQFAQQAAANPDDAQQAASDHIASVDPDHFQQSVQQGVDEVPDHQVGGIAGKILGALQGAGIDPGQVAQSAGLSSSLPHEMDKGDLTGLLGYAQQYAPQVLGTLASNHPEIAQALGGPMVKGLLGRLLG